MTGQKTGRIQVVRYAVMAPVLGLQHILDTAARLISGLLALQDDLS